MKKSMIIVSVSLLMLSSCAAMLDSVVTKSLDKMDTDRDGKVSKQEYITQVKKEGEDETKAAKDFEEMDANKDGYLVADEIKGM